MVNQYYSYARKIHLVMDNYTTHKLKNLYDYFPLGKAKDIADKICVHYTPTHASWLNAVEPEFSVMERQCLNERIGTVDQLRSISKNWEKIRNREVKGVDWQFTTDDARIKLKSLYPTLLV